MTIESYQTNTPLPSHTGHTSPDAQNYMRTHSIEEDDLPHIAVIDSRTGAKIVTMKGKLCDHV
jgi:hypothetical protein